MDLGFEIDPPRESPGNIIVSSVTIVDGVEKLILAIDRKKDLLFYLLWNLDEKLKEKFSFVVSLPSDPGGIIISAPIPYQSAMALYRSFEFYMKPEDLPDNCWRFLR